MHISDRLWLWRTDRPQRRRSSGAATGGQDRGSVESKVGMLHVFAVIERMRRAPATVDSELPRLPHPGGSLKIEEWGPVPGI
jgi:hypothetical protein